jgi:glycosyltransferase involved in cell wall biosynthesis
MAATVAGLSGRTEGLWVNRPAVAVEAIPHKSYGASSEPPTVLAAGRLIWVKGYDYLLEAFARLKRNGVAFRAEILGGGPLQAPMRYSIQDLGIQPEVTLVGNIPGSQVLERMRQSDVFVLPSVFEGISNAALEAMASGLPVVTTNAGGMAEAVRDGVDGYVVPVRDIDALADRLGSLLADAGLRQRMGQSARGRVEQEFRLDRQARVFERMYTAMVEQGAPTRS